MQGTTEADVWVVARIAALERANRRLWIGLSALLMALVTLVAVAALLATTLEIPGGIGSRIDRFEAASIRAGEVAATSALRLVDEQGRDLVRIAREPGAGGARAGQTVIGVFSADPRGAAPQEALHLAASAMGSALSLGTPDGGSSASLFVAPAGASLELRRGEQTRVLSDSGEDSSLTPPAVAATPQPAAVTPPSVGARAEAPAVSRPVPGETRGVAIDLTDSVLQPLGQDFYVGRLALSDAGGALRVSGRIVNASSVDQLRVEFRLWVASRELPFSVARIAAGNSTPFALEIPSASNAELREARIRWVRSTLNYGTE